MRPIVGSMLACLACALYLGSAHAAPPGEPIVVGPAGAFGAEFARIVLHGAADSYVDAPDGAAMLERLRAERAHPTDDVVVMDAATAATACAEGLVETLNARALPVIHELDLAAQDDGGACGPGLASDMLVIAYDTRQVQDAPRSLRDLWEPRWRGKVAIPVPPDPRSLALIALLAYAETSDWRQAGAVFGELRALSPSLVAYDPAADGFARVADGEVAMAIAMNAGAQRAADRSHGRVGVVLPDEGTVASMQTINVVRGAPHREAALALVAAALSPPLQKAFCEAMYLAPANVRTVMDARVADRTAAAPFNRAREAPVNWPDLARMRDAWTERWRKEVFGATQ